MDVRRAVAGALGLETHEAEALRVVGVQVLIARTAAQRDLQDPHTGRHADIGESGVLKRSVGQNRRAGGQSGIRRQAEPVNHLAAFAVGHGDLDALLRESGGPVQGPAAVDGHAGRATG